MTWTAIDNGITGWTAEAIDHDSEGECHRVVFCGADAERLCREFVDRKNAENAENAARP